jgi:hypothetical protein
MNYLDKLTEIASDSRIELAQSFKELIHKKLVLGQSRYLCRFGTLSDGHEKITPAQRYFQAIKEMWYIGNNIRTNEANALNFQADLTEAEQSLENATTDVQKLRARAKKIHAETSLISALVQIEDQVRMLDEYNKIRLELEPEVDAKYPGGIEQSERDSWLAVAEYRRMVEETPGMARQLMSNVPLDPVVKANLGISWGRQDMIAPMVVAEQKQIEEIADGDVTKYVIYKTKELKQLENE